MVTFLFVLFTDISLDNMDHPRDQLQEKYKRLSVNSVLEQLIKNDELFWQNVHHKY